MMFMSKEVEHYTPREHQTHRLSSGACRLNACCWPCIGSPLDVDLPEVVQARKVALSCLLGLAMHIMALEPTLGPPPTWPAPRMEKPPLCLTIEPRDP